MRYCKLLTLMSLALLISIPTAMVIAEETFKVIPQKVTMHGNFAQTQLLVRQAVADGGNVARAHDLTRDVTYASSHPETVEVTHTGRLIANANGQAEIKVSYAKTTSTIPVTVTGITEDAAVDFDLQVMPIISKAGCNMGACHASQHGKGGFKLSVFGFEADKDWEMIVKASRQRRINLMDPEASLFLKKPTMQIPHGGGERLDKESLDYQLLVSWLKNGAPEHRKSAPKVTKLTVSPTDRICDLEEEQQIRVLATYSDETVRDVTAWAKYDSLDEGVVEVADAGIVKTVGQGQAPVMVRFEGQAGLSTFVVPYSESVQLAGWVDNNYVDELASAKFRELGIEPSGLCDDATFVRRAYLDAIGTLPTIEQTTRFLESSDPNKREQLIDQLLGMTGDSKLDIYNDQYAAYWTLKWSDLIRNNSNDLGEQGMWAMHNWIKESFRTNKPFDQFVYELVTAKGSIYSNGPANYFRVNRNATDLCESTAQLFLGIRMQCAKCHHHPFEKYSQADYYGFTSYFSRVGTKPSEEFGLFGRESVVVVRNSGDVRHPKTGKTMKPTPLEGKPVDHPLDRRIALAKWMVSPDNEFFAKSVVNRYVAYFLGRGLVEPIDDMRATNPPTNVPLMNALAEEFVESQFNLKAIIRSIMVSRLYQLQSQPTEQNKRDSKFYSHYKVKRLAAEPLLDAIDRATGVQTKYTSLPLGTRAIELPDAEYTYRNYFLTTFGKPKRASVCECERMPDENLSQALHTLNGDSITSKISSKKGRMATLLAEKKQADEIVTELYLCTLCRYPTQAEMSRCQQLLENSPSAKEFYEDLFWSLMNSKQFLFNH